LCEEYAKRPHINWGTLISMFAEDDLWCHIVRRATGILKLFALCENCTKAEIYYLHDPLTAVKGVFKL